MKLLLIRKKFLEDRTLGELFTPDGYFCDTMEPHRIDWTKEKKVKGKTAIPEGRYQVKLAWSQKRGRVVPWLEKVPHFTGIQIHTGNVPTNTSGCILVGDGERNILVNSNFCFNQLMKKLKETKEAIYITVAHSDDRDRVMKEMFPHYTPDDDDEESADGDDSELDDDDDDDEEIGYLGEELEKFL